MKKILLIGLILLTICGCKSTKPTNVIEKFQNKVADSKSYYLKGTMQIIGDEDTFNYDIETVYLKDNNYKVTLVNQVNNHEQIILRNNEGIFVITPSLNKSFKFQSEWPNNSSQTYILEALSKDIKNDKETTVTEEDGKYIIKTKVNYPNNNELTSQKIIVNKKAILEGVEVSDSAGNVKIKLAVNKIDMKYNADTKDFELNKLINQQPTNKEEKTDEENCTETSCEKTSSLESAIYPLYLPAETKLSNTETVETDNGQRVILTFSGDKNFVLVEEQSVFYDEHEIIPVYGDPLMLADTVAALSDNSIYWTSNNVDYYLTSKDLSSGELLTIANSLGNSVSVSESK